MSKTTTKTTRKPAAKKMASTAAPNASMLTASDLGSIQKIFARRYNKGRGLVQNVTAFHKELKTASNGFTIPA